MLYHLSIPFYSVSKALKRCVNADRYAASIAFVIRVVNRSCLIESVRLSVPKSLVVALLLLTVDQAIAQSASSGAFVVVEERVKQADGQTIVSYRLASDLDTLISPVRFATPSTKQGITPKPVWRTEIAAPDEQQGHSFRMDSGLPNDFYPTPIAPGAAAYKQSFWFSRYP